MFTVRFVGLLRLRAAIIGGVFSPEFEFPGFFVAIVSSSRLS